MNGERIKKTGMVLAGGVLIAGLAMICSLTITPLVWRHVHFNTEALMRGILAAAGFLPQLVIALGVGWVLFRRIGADLPRRTVLLWGSAPWLVLTIWGVARALVRGQAEASALVSVGLWSSLLCVPLGLTLAGYLASRFPPPAGTAAADPPAGADGVAFGLVPKLFLLVVIVLVSLLAGGYAENLLAYHLLPMLMFGDYYMTGFVAFSVGAAVMAAVSAYPLVAVFGQRAPQAGWAIPAVLVAMRLYNLFFNAIGRTGPELIFNAYEAILLAALIHFATSRLARKLAR